MQTADNTKIFLYQILSLFVLAFLLYANTINHKYALDDSIVVKENTLTQQGFAGISEIMKRDAFYGFFGDDRNLVAGGRYRPLSIVTLAIEYEFFGLNPTVSHIINILLYGGLCVLIFLVSITLLKNNFNNQHFFSIPFLIALLFAAHPIHTEAVANIKGRDEIMGMLGAIGALLLFVRYLDSKNILLLITALFIFFLGLLSKENVITFLAVFPLAAYFFRSGQLKQSILPIAGFIACAGLYLFLRHTFTGGDFTPSTTVLNNAYHHATGSEKIATIIFTIGKYFQLLVFPHPLTHDHYFNQIPLKSWGDWRVLLTLLSLAALGYFTVKGALQKNPLAFGVMYFFITFSIVSNVLFNVGTTMSERLIFMPSFGFVLVLAVLLNMVLKKYVDKANHLKMRTIIVSIICLGFAVKTIERNPAWKDNATLFSTDIQYSPNSAKLNNALGGTLVDSAKVVHDVVLKHQLLEDGIFYLNRAVEIYPPYTTAWNLLGIAHYLKDSDIQTISSYYQNALRAAPSNFESNLSFGIILKAKDRPAESLTFLQTASRVRPGSYEARYHLGDAYFNTGQAENALNALNAALQINPSSHESYYKIGTVYGRLMNDFPRAVTNFQQAITLNPNLPHYHEDLGVAYGFMGEHQNAIEAFERVLQLRPGHTQAYRNMAASFMAIGNTERAQYYMMQAEQQGR